MASVSELGVGGVWELWCCWLQAPAEGGPIPKLVQGVQKMSQKRSTITICQHHGASDFPTQPAA